MEAKSTVCPHCGGQLPADKVAGSKIFNCPNCGQAIHPANCICGQCNPEMAEIDADLELGLAALARMKAIRREDEAERQRSGLPPREATGTQIRVTDAQGRSVPVIQVGGDIGAIHIVQSGKVCRVCNTENSSQARFCKNCGTKLGSEKQCTGCGKYSRHDTDFCPNCGKRLT